MGPTRKRRSLVVGLMVVFGLSSVGVASASAALPEMVNKEGKALVKSKFTGTTGFGHALTWVTKKNGGVTCSEAKGSGEVTGLQNSHSAWTWTGCEAAGTAYQTEGAKRGEIRIPELKGQLVYEVYEKGTVLEPALLLTLAKELTFGTNLILEPMHLRGSFLVRLPSVEEFRNYLYVDGVQSGGQQEGTGEYEETRGGEVKKASLLMNVEGVKKYTNEPTALEFDEKRTFEEEFRINW
jgi:hypothetical protein